MKIAFQGEHGAYSEAAIFEHFGPQNTSEPCETFDAVFTAVSEGACDCGMVPVENSLAGSIHRNYDLLLQNTLYVTGEHVHPISHCLIAHPGVSRAEIRRVISHPQAIAQCEHSLRGLGDVKVEPVYDTAGSVKMLKESGERTTAAIASHRAADLYGMQVLAEHFEDLPTNFTRFLVISREPVSAGPDAKTSIVFALKNVPGALFRAMSVFALRDIDLTKIESRPLVGKLWEYFFYVDFIGSVDDENAGRALANLEEFATFLRVLGSYPRWKGG
jgi:prephenate dehydratase